MKEVRVALIGFGGIAKSHKAGYESIAAEGLPIRLVAICDVDEKRFAAGSVTNLGVEKAASLEGINTYTDLEKLIAEEDFDMADICVPTYLHKEVAIRLMKAGKDVLSEKPMALSSADCEEMLRVAKECDSRLMIGQVLRFEPTYLYLKECVDDGRFGKLKHLFMERLSALPRWGFEHWFEDTARSGGCILDMHIHDIDMARFLLGEPGEVSADAYDETVRWQVIDSRLFYDNNVTVVARGSWDEATSVPFTAGYRARFEKASVILDGSGVTVYPDGGKPYKPELPAKKRMAEEIKALAALAADHSVKESVNPPESAYLTVKLVEKLRESVELGGARVKVDY